MRVLAILVAVTLAGCAATPHDVPPAGAPMTAAEGRALVARLIPDGTPDRNGWATDLYAALGALEIAPTAQNICAAIAIIQQESGFRVDPAVPGLAAIAKKEIEARRERTGVPRLVLDTALALPSSNGKSYGERLDAVKTEMQMSDLFEDFIGRVPLGRTFFADRNPVHTAGPMQVSVAFAESLAASRPYPYPMSGSVRSEVFTRRGGLYFGVAHLLDFRAPYDRYIYRFADFNAGRYASRNAAFQSAVTQISGIPLTLDGDLLRYENGRPARDPGATETAVRVLARRLDVDFDAIRHDLALGTTEAFERSPVYTRVFAAADRTAGKKVPRAVLPDIELHSPKITRKLTTEWFAQRVDARYQSCLHRLDS
ncbi:MAG TPA: DUF1615 domain-containing protein [Casimicrobiaceae bacterium]|nr:DUF1615 domain-containing protein [Casimicrobiaceae bacterium]